MNAPASEWVCRVACRVAMTSTRGVRRNLAGVRPIRDETPPPLQWRCISSAPEGLS